MKECIECGYKFTYFDRLKIFFNLEGKFTCPKCKSVYRDESNWFRGIYGALVIFICSTIFLRGNLYNNRLNVIVYFIVSFCVFSLFDIIPHKWHKYKKVN